ncbi:Fatty acid hydroxylase domain-containing protein 2 [Nibea albiflora]|uniref:Fatty acid hydroxylase domain-containing protein 2 n=1 Tax=Nibea albiflora TaxID=240163 RepID=A0ACB7F641_NIBAL|nr:Fatty acid hydroxylase domain-containing protein 2 [Nibea albiflora]
MRGSATTSSSSRQEGPGGLWDSVKKAAFVIGSGILFLAAFGNSLTWHLQRFWGASGDFWQKLWTKVYLAFEGHDAALFFFGTMTFPTIAFWGLNIMLMVVDSTGKPSFITRYRIQMDKNNPVDPAKLRHAVKSVMFNYVCISGPMVLAAYYLTNLRRDPCGPELPTFHWALLELAVCAIVEEVMFYYSHSFITITVKTCSSRPQFSNMLPVVAGPIILGSHLCTTTLWYCLALVSTSISHCGYHLPFLPSPEFHDFHHLKFNQCYGVFGVLDRLHGTDTKFRQTKQYERHVLLTSFTPLNESIPDEPKKGQ